MRKVISYIAAYTLYYIGDVFSKLAYSKWFCNNFTYNGYQNFMHWSCMAQEWGKINKPWGDIKTQD